MKRWRGAAVFAAGLVWAGSAGAQTGGGSRPITVIVPFAAGGPVDLETRMYTTRLAEVLGQPIIVDYRPGGGTSIGAAYVAKARPDGHTLLSSSSALAVFPALYKDAPIDVTTDLAPLAHIQLQR